MYTVPWHAPLAMLVANIPFSEPSGCGLYVVTELAGSKVMVRSGSTQSQRHEFVRDHCVPVQSNVVDFAALSLGVGPSTTDATQLPDEQSVANRYQAV